MSDTFFIGFGHSSDFCCSDKILGPKTLGEEIPFIFAPDGSSSKETSAGT